MVSAASAFSLPIGVWPYGCSPYRSWTKVRSATAPGTSRSCVSRCSRSCRTRWKSASVREGRAIMSARSASPRSANRPSVVIVACAASAPMSVSNCAPIRARSSWRPIAVRSPLPSSSMSAVSAARPSLPTGSPADPRCSSITKVTTGTGACRTLHTRRPLGSTDLAIAGNVKGRATPGSGSRERLTVTTRRPAPNLEWPGRGGREG